MLKRHDRIFFLLMDAFVSSFHVFFVKRTIACPVIFILFRLDSIRAASSRDSLRQFREPFTIETAAAMVTALVSSERSEYDQTPKLLIYSSSDITFLSVLET